MISIIIPVYNQASKLAECLESILKQSILKKNINFKYPKIEIIIVNDGSTDKIEKIVKNFEDKNKKIAKIIFLNQENRGAPSARNKGFYQSQGKYLLFCDADIILYSDMLEKMFLVLEEKKEIAFAYASHEFGNKVFRLFPYSAERLKKMPYIHTTSLIRRKFFPKKGWDENIKKFQDWDLWLTILNQGQQGYFIDKVLFKIQPGGTISNWLPSFFYKIFPFLPSVRKYKKAMEIIKKKHGL